MTIEIHQAFNSRIKLNVRQSFYDTFKAALENDCENISYVNVNHKWKCISQSNNNTDALDVRFYFKNQKTLFIDYKIGK